MNPKNNLPPVHPGEFLKDNLDELQISQAEFARTIGLSAMRISHVVKGKRPVTAEMALLFGKAFGQTPQYWINLQATYDLKMAEKVSAAGSLEYVNLRMHNVLKGKSPARILWAVANMDNVDELVSWIKDFIENEI